MARTVVEMKRSRGVGGSFLPPSSPAGRASIQRPLSASSGSVVSRLFEHSPRQLRTARERLEEARGSDGRGKKMHAPADPHSIGRTRSEAEVRPEAGKGRKAVEGAGLSAGKLDGAGASVKVERNEEAKRAIRGEMVRSSLGADGGFLVGHGEEEKRKIMSQEVMMSIKGHMTGAAILDDGVKVEGQRARASVASAPKGYITDMKSLLGGEDASFKPARRQIEHKGVTMLEVEVGVPATLDRYGRCVHVFSICVETERGRSTCCLGFDLFVVDLGLRSNGSTSISSSRTLRLQMLLVMLQNFIGSSPTRLLAEAM